jgi:hypothetical protein
MRRCTTSVIRRLNRDLILLAADHIRQCERKDYCEPKLPMKASRTLTRLKEPFGTGNLFIQQVPYDAVNRNKVSIRQLAFTFLLSHYMFRPLWAIFRWDIQLDIFNALFLLQQIHCTYAIWCRDVICCTSVLWLVVLIHVIIWICNIPASGSIVVKIVH